MIHFLRDFWKYYSDNRAKRLDVAEKANIAKVFNDRYAYKKPYGDKTKWLPQTGSPDGALSRCQSGYTWMCPQCNKIHEPLSWSVFSGLQYPACCDYFEGHRLDY